MKITLRMCVPFMLIATALFLNGCASMSATTAPGADLSGIKKVHVVTLPKDERGIDRIVADELVKLGYDASVGTRQDAPTDADAVLTYQDKWMWDITMYMIELNVQVRNPKSDITLASGKSYRPSLQRRSPAAMASEVLTNIFQSNPAQ